MIDRVFLLHHTHVDFGYTDSRDKVCNELVDMVDQVIDLVETSRNRPEPERFRWIHEVSWPVVEYLHRPTARRERLFEQMRSGLVELTALHMHPTELFDRDTFEASIDYACDLARENGLPLTTAMFSDSPGIAWSLPDILAARGVRFLSAAPDFIMSLPLEVGRPFYWEGPGGDRLLTWFTDWRQSWYAEGLYPLKLTGEPAEATRLLLAYCRQLEAEGYRWRALAIHVAMDNVPPAPALMDFVAHFNAQATGVSVQMATNRDFFEFMEAHHAKEFAVHRAAWPDWWANGSASAAYESACSRRAKAALRRSAALSKHLGAPRDPALFEQAMADLLRFDEHTWGHSTSVSAPWSLDARLGWAQKRADALGALDKATKLERAASQSLKKDGHIVVVNPFSDEWHGVIRLDGIGPGLKAPMLVDRESGEKVPGQRERSTHGARAADSYVLHVPGGASRIFGIGKATAPQAADRFQNEHYRIDYDTATGAIKAIEDKASGQPLCDAGAPWSFAELIHERVERGSREAMYDVTLGTTNPASHRPRPSFIRKAAHTASRGCRFAAGPVYHSLTTSGRLPGVRFVRQVRLYHAIRRIDVLLRLDKSVVTDYESLYLAFPFASLDVEPRRPIDVEPRRPQRENEAGEGACAQETGKGAGAPRSPDTGLGAGAPQYAEGVEAHRPRRETESGEGASRPEVWIEDAGALYRAGVDQLPGSATDWHSVGEYVAVSGGDQTIVLAPHDAPVIQVGDIHTGKWAKRLQVESGHIYSWLMNNMWYTNFPAYQEGVVELVEDPWRWGEVYVMGGVQAFRWWQG